MLSALKMIDSEKSNALLYYSCLLVVTFNDDMMSKKSFAVIGLTVSLVCVWPRGHPRGRLHLPQNP